MVKKTPLRKIRNNKLAIKEGFEINPKWQVIPNLELESDI